jgi:hypothetical protein
VIDDLSMDDRCNISEAGDVFSGCTSLPTGIRSLFAKFSIQSMNRGSALCRAEHAPLLAIGYLELAKDGVAAQWLERVKLTGSNSETRNYELRKM